MKTKLVFLPFMLMLLFLASFSFAQAVDLKGNDLEIMLDCSGSMAQTIDGKSKLDIAKESLSSVVSSIPDGANVGFRAYGHRNAVSDKVNSCKDSELIFPIGPIDKSGIMAKINSLQAKGWTPIDYSLRQAKNDFPAQEEYGKRIILVSDGEETCGGDPCAAVKELINSGFKVQVDTVGFDVDSNTEKQLRCIAEASGGEYKSAKNANELTESLRVFSTRAFEGYKASGNVIPGLGFSDAPLVSPGIYGADLLVDESKFYKFNVKKGQHVYLSASFKRERTSCNVPCISMLPGIVSYDSAMSAIKESRAKFWGNSDTDPERYGINGNDTTPKTWKVDFIAERSGEYFVSVSNAWYRNPCDNMDEFNCKGVKDFQKQAVKAFYDVKITIEGAGIEEPAATISASASPATENTIDSNANNSENAPPTSSFIKWLLIILIALILLVGGGFLFYFIKKKNNQTVPKIPLGNNFPNPNVAVPPAPASPSFTPPVPPAPSPENPPPPQSKDASNNQDQPTFRQ